MPSVPRSRDLLPLDGGIQQGDDARVMSPTSRAILQSVLATDATTSAAERSAIQRLLDGNFEAVPAARGDEPLLVPQKVAAQLLSLSRVTVWRLTKEDVLHPVEVLPGTWRYPYAELVALSRSGWKSGNKPGASSAVAA